MAGTYKAKLIGGELDGQVVEIVGTYYIGRRFRSRRGWFEERYGWDQAADGSLVGVFRGYYDGPTRVDRIGRRLRKL